MMSVTLGSDSCLPYIESQATPVVRSLDGGSTTIANQAQRTTSTTSTLQKQFNDTQNAVISKMG